MIDLKNNLKFLIFFKYILIVGLFLSLVLPAMFNENLFVLLYNYHIYDAYMVFLFIFVLWCLYRIIRIMFAKKELNSI